MEAAHKARHLTWKDEVSDWCLKLDSKIWFVGLSFRRLTNNTLDFNIWTLLYIGLHGNNSIFYNILFSTTKYS